MDGFTPAGSFGPEVAARYDDELRGDEEAAVDFLADLARGGAALELAIGTGRIALPLAARGVRVDGIDLSTSMIEQLRGKPGGHQLRVAIGDMARDTVDGPYDVVFVVYNSIFNILTQDEQVSCFETVARQLAPDGVFVVEAAPPWAWLPAGQNRYARPEYVAAESVHLDVVDYDPVTQLFRENHLRFDTDGIHFGPIAQRVITPAEMDLMARLAGLRLRTRTGGWRGETFSADSAVQVSVYEHR